MSTYLLSILRRKNQLFALDGQKRGDHAVLCEANSQDLTSLSLSGFLMLNEAKTPKGSAKLNVGIAAKRSEAKPTSGKLCCHHRYHEAF